MTIEDTAKKLAEDVVAKAASTADALVNRAAVTAEGMIARAAMAAELAVERTATAAAKAAVLEVLVTLGVDAHDPKALLEMQADFAHIRTWRESVETVKTASIKTAVGIIVTGVLGAIYAVYHHWPIKP